MIIALIIAAVVVPMLSIVQNELVPLQSALSNDNMTYFYTIGDYLRVVNQIFPVLDGIFPISVLTFVIWQMFLSKKLLEALTNFIRGAGMRL